MEEQVRDVIAAAVSRFGRLDIVVNLAAASDAVIANGRRSVTEETNEGLMRQLKIDLIAPFWFFKYSIPEMKKVGGGTFVNISSLRSEEHTSELQSLMRISYAVFSLKKNKQ